MAFWPNANEQTYLEFSIGEWGLQTRYLVAGALFSVGLLFMVLSDVGTVAGIPLVLLGHLPLWVRTQTLAPAPTGSAEELVWTPADPDWYENVADAEERVRRWDVSPWDITSGRALGTILVVAGGVVAGISALGFFRGMDEATFFSLVFGTIALWAPMFWNGRRTPWHPNQLRITGEALMPVAHLVERNAPGDYDLVPLLGMREGKTGRYPVNARIMLRPSVDDGSGFIGIQIQVCLNNVRGTNYPYVYCVILGKPGFLIEPTTGSSLMAEPGEGDDVSYLVIRQFADRSSGWHTDTDVVFEIVKLALRKAAEARELNRQKGPPS